MQIRTLRASERPALLELLDGWEIGDGWRGRDFFRRLVEDDPSFEDRNVHVAVEAGRLVSCVQIFPRAVRLRGESVPMGGIGTVFMASEQRRSGVAGALLERAAADMVERGMELSILFAARIAWYTKLGWRSWRQRRTILHRDPMRPVSPSEPTIEPFDRGRDLAAVRALHEEFSATLDATVIRDERSWDASLRNAGNPGEEFLVARRNGELLAYARGVMLGGFFGVMEAVRAESGAAALATLVEQLMTAREPDPLAPAGKASAELRGRAFFSDLATDPDLAASLAGRGLRTEPIEDPMVMLRCLDAPALAARLGVDLEPGEEPNDFLARVLPPGSSRFQVADRF